MINTSNLADQLFKTLSSVEGVYSVSLVGSVTEQESLTETSDIDTIVICKKLTRTVFDACVSAVGALSGEDLGAPGRKVFVNSTFGPLKFDDPGTLVIHLMVYDLEGHRDHVLKSPFTCFDWERSERHVGPSLKEIYPVLRLQPSHLLNARRGINSYLDDIEKGVISFRKYDFEGAHIEQVPCQQTLDPRHKGEYAFHIMKMLVINYAKILLNENRRFDFEELCSLWEEQLPTCRPILPFFRTLEKLKKARAHSFPEETISVTASFLKGFFQDVRSTWEPAREVDFIRHGKTALNDGSFLGIGRNPELESVANFQPLEKTYATLFSSPMKRTLQSAAMLQPDTPVKKEALLLEQDYGEVEGLSYPTLSQQYPDMISAWAEKEDPCFPGGENTRNVDNRLQAFLKKLAENADDTAFPALAVTHNVVLRCLLGNLFGVPMEDWFHIPTRHMEPIPLQLRSGTYYPNLSREQRGELIDAVSKFAHRLEEVSS